MFTFIVTGRMGCGATGVGVVERLLYLGVCDSGLLGGVCFFPFAKAAHGFEDDGDQEAKVGVALRLVDVVEVLDDDEGRGASSHVDPFWRSKSEAEGWRFGWYLAAIFCLHYWFCFHRGEDDEQDRRDRVRYQTKPK
jgi:hypothetical protein